MIFKVKYTLKVGRKTFKAKCNVEADSAFEAQIKVQRSESKKNPNHFVEINDFDATKVWGDDFYKNIMEILKMK